MKGVLTVQHQDDIFIPDIYGGHARIAVLFPGGWKKWWTPLGIDPSLSSFPISTNRRAPRDSKVSAVGNVTASRFRLLAGNDLPLSNHGRVGTITKLCSDEGQRRDYNP
jgi:hypothetical protein